MTANWQKLAVLLAALSFLSDTAYSQTQSAGINIAGDVVVYTAPPAATVNSTTRQAFVDKTQATAEITDSSCNPVATAIAAAGLSVATGTVKPTCLWTWTELPDTVTSNSGLNVQGTWSNPGSRTLGYTVSVVDTNGTVYPLSSGSTAITVTGDVTAPTVSFQSNGSVFTGGSVSALADLTMSLSDAADPAPQATGVTVQGNSSPQTVTTTSTGTNTYAFVWPTLKPGIYTLAVSTSDSLGNTGTTSLQFTYAPPHVGWGQAGGVLIPAITTPLQTSSGTWPATSATLRTNGSNSGTIVSGNLPWTVGSDPISTVTVVVNGITVAPGATGVQLGTINTPGGDFAVPVAAATTGQGGVAHLTFATNVINAPLVIGDVDVYTVSPTITLNSPTETAFTGETIAGASTVGNSCSMVNSAQAAQGFAVSVIGKTPVCLWTWTGLPDVVDSNTGLSIKGHWTTAGQRNLGYSVSVVGNDGTIYPMASGASTVSVSADTVPPKVTFDYNNTAFTGGDVLYLGGLTIALSDPADPSPQLTSVALQSGSGATTQALPYTSAGAGVYSLTWPTLKAGLYTITVGTSDSLGNTGSSALTFTYAPPQVGWVQSGAIHIPAVTSAVHTSSGSWPATSAVLRANASASGTLITGALPFTASSDPTSTVTVVVNGVAIAPGAVATSIGSITTTTGSISMPVAAATQGQAGVAHLTLTTNVPYAPAVVGDVDVYAAGIQVAVAKNPMRQMLDSLSAVASVTSGAGCTVTQVQSQAIGLAANSSPVCLFQWDYSQVPLTVAKSTMTLTGDFTNSGSFPLNYSLSVVDDDGTVYPMATGTTTLNVTPTSISATLGLTGNLNQYDYLVIPSTITMGTTGGDFPCRMTSSETDAVANEGNSTSPVCLGTFTSLPPGFTANAAASSVPPRAVGVFGTQPASFGLQAIWYSSDGTPYVVGQNTVTVQANDPPAPTISFAGNNPAEISTAGGSIGTLKATTPILAPMLVSVVDESGTSVMSTTANPIAGTSSVQFNGSITVPSGLKLNATKVYTISAGYAALPAEATTTTETLTVVPAPTVMPTISTTATTAMTTSSFPVTVALADTGTKTFDPTTMGTWQVEIAATPSYNQFVPLTGWTSVGSDGTATINVTPAGLTGSVLHLVAIAQQTGTGLTVQRVSPTITLLLLIGDTAPVTVTATPATGPIPFTTTLSASVPLTAVARNVMGASTWQVSTDGGTNWQPVSVSPSNSIQVAVPNGGAEFTATMTNTNSLLSATSPPITVTPFNVVSAMLNGPANIYVGQSPAYSLTVTENGVPLNASQYSVQWSLNQGISWTGGSGTYTLDTTAMNPGYTSLWAQVKDVNAPNVPSAWTTVKTSIDVTTVSKPLVTINVPYSVQVDVPLNVSATILTSDTTLTKSGVWTFPDGTTATGLTATWTPPTSLLNASKNATVSFVGTVTATSGEQASADANATIILWQYVLSPIQLNVSTADQYAPTQSTITASLVQGMMPAGSTVSWSIPNDATTVTSSGTRIVVTEPDVGSVTYGATLTDIYGNQVTASKTISVPAPPPFNISFVTSLSNQWSRAPLSVTMIPNISGGHPKDSVASLTFIVDGVPQATGTSNLSRGTVVVPVGTHQISINLLSTMGVTATASQNITAVAPVPPTCTISGTTNASSWVATAKCNTTNTNITGYQWTLNGTPLIGVTSKSITLSTASYSTKPSVSLTVTDDAGDTSTPANW